MLNDSNATLLKKEEVYPGSANSPTLVYTYSCPCGKGVIEYVRVPGFDDYYAEIKCDDCAEKYTVRTGCGHLWELIFK